MVDATDEEVSVEFNTIQSIVYTYIYIEYVYIYIYIYMYVCIYMLTQKVDSTDEEVSVERGNPV